jgi:hypothetical protein
MQQQQREGTRKSGVSAAKFHQQHKHSMAASLHQANSNSSALSVRDVQTHLLHWLYTTARAEEAFKAKEKKAEVNGMNCWIQLGLLNKILIIFFYRRNFSQLGLKSND